MSYRTTHYFLLGAVVSNKELKALFNVESLDTDEFWEPLECYKMTHYESNRKNGVSIVFGEGESSIGYIIARTKLDSDVFEFADPEQEGKFTPEEVSTLIENEFGFRLHVKYTVFSDWG